MTEKMTKAIGFIQKQIDSAKAELKELNDKRKTRSFTDWARWSARDVVLNEVALETWEHILYRCNVCIEKGHSDDDMAQHLIAYRKTMVDDVFNGTNINNTNSFAREIDLVTQDAFKKIAGHSRVDIDSIFVLLTDVFGKLV